MDEKINIEKNVFEIKNGVLTKVNVRKYPKEFNIPNGVRKIASLALPHFSYEREFDAIGLPDTLEEIPSFMLIWRKIRECILPKNLKSIGDFSFYCCKKLKEIEIVNGTKSLGQRVFSNCYSLNKIVMHDTIESIGERVFVIEEKKNGDEFYCSKLPSEIVIRYSSFDTLYVFIERLISSGNFDFYEENVPVFSFKLEGPVLSEVEVNKLYLLLLKTRVTMVNGIDINEIICNSRNNTLKRVKK